MIEYPPGTKREGQAVTLPDGQWKMEVWRLGDVPLFTDIVQGGELLRLLRETPEDGGLIIEPWGRVVQPPYRVTFERSES